MNVDIFVTVYTLNCGTVLDDTRNIASLTVLLLYYFFTINSQ